MVLFIFARSTVVLFDPLFEVVCSSLDRVDVGCFSRSPTVVLFEGSRAGSTVVDF